MLVASSATRRDHGGDSKPNTTNNSSGIIRSSSFSDHKTVVIWRRRNRTRSNSRSVVSGHRQLSCVVEHLDTNCQQSDDCVDRKIFRVANNVSTAHSTANDKEEECGNMSWRNKTSSPSPGPSSDGSYSWIDSLSSKISDKTRKKANGFFGSLRGKSHSEKRRGSSDGLFNTATPRSPLLFGNKTNTKQSSPTKQFFTLTKSKRPQNLLPDNNSSTKNSLQSSSQFGSCHELSSYTNNSKHTDVIVRKTNSLPRSILCSPVMSRQVKRPTSQWLIQNDYLMDEEPDSPLSSVISSNHGSSETIQPLVCDTVLTPTEKQNGEFSSLGGWKSVSPNGRMSDQVEPVLKTSLTRSSSMPFETFDMFLQESIPKRNLPARLSLGGENCTGFSSCSRLATRSQSFNTHFNTHSHVQRTQSQESMIMREHIVRFLLETEQSYISSLRALSKDYQDIFYQIECPSLQEVLLLVPSLASKHEEFSQLVSERINDWYHTQCIGDVLVKTFSHQQFNKLYTSFIHHYSKARASLENAKQTKHSISKALEDLSRESHGKLTVEDLLIKPVQRIPRYLLFVKDLIKQTHPSHPDYHQLQEAQQELTTLANHVNESERQSERLQQHKDLLSMVEGLNEVLSESSSLIRCDTVTEIRGTTQKKDRLLMLYTDTLICAASKRRGSGFRKGSLMNVNSIQNDMLKYHIKWSSLLSSLIINQSPAPLVERRRYNTLEKTLHNLHKDEEVVLQMLTSASALQYPHTELENSLQTLLSSIRNTMNKKRQEMETLPQETSRIDITSHDGSPPTKYSLIFSSQKDRCEWEQLIRTSQLTISQQNESKKKQKKPLTPESIPRYLWHVALPTCRVGSQLSSIAIPAGSSNQFFVCVNDVCGRGNIAILNSHGRTSKDTPPTLVATLPLSSSRLLCSLCAEHPPTDQLLNVQNHADTPSSVCDRTSISSEEYLLDTDESFFPYSPLNSETSETRPLGQHLTTPHDYDMASSYIVPSTDKVYHMSTLPVPDGNQWLWLGSQEGILYVLKVGVASLHVSSSLSINVGAAVVCLMSVGSHGNHADMVWAGLADGTIAVFNLKRDISHAERYVSVSSLPVVAMATVGADLQRIVASGNSIVSIDTHWYCKELFKLSETITNMVTNGNWIFISVQGSLTIRVYSCDVTMETIMTLDCNASVTASLKYYNPIIKQHKCTNCFITNMTVSDKMLVIGTSAGVVVALPLPFTAGKIPSIHALSRGHVDTVSTLLVVPHGHRHILISGGHGLEELLKAKSSDNISETEGCLLFWYLSNHGNKIKSHPLKL